MNKKRPASKKPGVTATSSAQPSATARRPGPSATQVRADTRARGLQRRRRRQLGLFGVAAVLVVAGVVSLALRSSSPKVGDNTTTTAWVLPRLGQSGTVSLASLRGKPVVVNMFASWCTVCRGELPAFAAEARRLRGRATIVEVNSLETGNGRAMAQQFGLASAGALVLSDVGGAQNSGLHDALGGGNNMPVSAFYSASGQLLATHLGGFSAATLQAQLTKLYGSHV